MERWALNRLPACGVTKVVVHNRGSWKVKLKPDLVYTLGLVALLAYNKFAVYDIECENPEHLFEAPLIEGSKVTFVFKQQ
jgi:hypothetical protein